jgi:hypothetical protein
MIWILLTAVCAYVAIALLVVAVVRSRHPQLSMLVPLRPVTIPPARPANENATRRFVALDAIRACRDSASDAATRRVRASFIEAAVTSRLLDDLEDDDIA